MCSTNRQGSTRERDDEQGRIDLEHGLEEQDAYDGAQCSDVRCEWCGDPEIPPDPAPTPPLTVPLAEIARLA